MYKSISHLVLHYFRLLARLQLKKNPRAIIIGVTGSSGKTSTRLAIVQLLKTKGLVKHTVHANSESGIPLNILGLAPTTYSRLDWLRLICLAPIRLLTLWEHYDYYVVEMGIDSPDSPKNMSYLLSILTPHVAVVLSASLTHAQNFDYLVKDRDATRRAKKILRLIAREKMLLATAVGKSGVAIVNFDQIEFRPYLNKIQGRLLTFGTNPKANLRIMPHFRFGYQGINAQLKSVELPAYYAYNMAATLAVGCALGIPLEQGVSRLSPYTPPPGRLRLFPGIKGSTVIDSSYNASPSTVSSALRFLQQIGRNHAKIAVLGDMHELGHSAKQAHKELSDILPRYSDQAILFGPLTKAHTLPVLLAKHFPVMHFERMSALIKYLSSSITPKSVVLIKGSQNQLYLERAVASILKDPKDLQHLCRRGKYWDLLRRQAP